MVKRKVLYISQEITPYLAETPMSLICRLLPQAIQERGCEVRTFMPKYGCINERRNQLHEVIRLSGMNIIIDDTDHPLIIKVATLQPARMQVYFIDSDDYFQHSAGKELETISMPQENDERVIFFARGVIETVKKLRWEPAIIHCSGWIASLAPAYIKRIYNEDPSFRSSKVVFSLFDNAFDGSLNERFAEKLRLSELADDDIKALGSGAVDSIALQKMAIDHADAVIQESAAVPQELIDYAKASGKPFLPYIEGEEEKARFDRYADLYDSLK